ncbi:MFS general substrate transporter [Lichtheimia hyalospora FSU 10163]|nr:MFS general substrate transporter [Lichtheimia hyalospora FSU 10163]
MIGNLLSSAMWIFAQSFSMFLLARIVAGLSEGNVQLSIAIISDVTEPEKRSKHLALVGIAFAVAFTLGPAIGAWFASVDLSQLHPIAAERLGIYPYSTPALVALVLLLIETVYIYFKLPETIHIHSNTSKDSEETSTQPVSDALSTIETRLANLKRLKWIHGLHLFLFSGMEFTLVFLTFDVLDYTNMQQGKLLAYMGILSALIQGGYVRRRVQKLGEKALVLQGMVSCTLGLVCLGIMASSSVSTSSAVQWLYAGVSCLALTTGTVVNCLTGLASLQCQDDKAKDTHPLLAKGRALGEFRSSGQLGRALGPVSACGLYWIAGPQRCYAAAALGMSLITLLAAAVAPTTKHTNKAKIE